MTRVSPLKQLFMVSANVGRVGLCLLFADVQQALD